MSARIGSAADLARAFDVPRETTARLARFVHLLTRWNRTINLISRRDLPQVWHRHVADSVQLWPLRPPAATTWLDLGPGAGFPGLVIAVLAAETGIPHVHLVESDRRKAAFLHAAVGELGLAATVHATRIETLRLDRCDVVSARALAPLATLVGHAAALRHPDGVALFPKGEAVHKELDAAQRLWDFQHRLHPSRTDPRAAIVEIGAIHGPRATDDPRPGEPEGRGR